MQKVCVGPSYEGLISPAYLPFSKSRLSHSFLWRREPQVFDFLAGGGPHVPFEAHFETPLKLVRMCEWQHKTAFRKWRAALSYTSCRLLENIRFT
ncbi:hypothetical protein PoB_003251000 [Plakobranchus ocellatus]|uniref:Uncharacterized protein n=1 Tax=Plakobranchus ocellatus TaxID=259542 RepID=A0AAV4AF46_9GAST|nr:hypothetical protein PoB_003251000 [Plakobranchus ocellatus]